MIEKLKNILFTKNTFSSVVWFSIFGFLQPAINIFLLPLYLQKLTPEEFGIVAMVGVFSSLAVVFASFKLDTAVRTFYFDYNQDEEKLWDYLSQVYTFLIGSSIVLFGIFYLIGPFIYQSIFKSDDIHFFPFGIMSLSFYLLTAINTIFYIYLKNQIRLKTFFAYSIFSVLMTAGFQAYFILGNDMKVTGVLGGSLLSVIIIFLAILINNRNLINFKISWKMIKPSLAFSFPLIPLTILLVLGAHLDKFVLEHLMDLKSLGLYAILMTIVGVSKLVINALDNGIRPFLYQSIKDGGVQSNHNVNLFKDLYVFVGILALSGIIMVGSNIQLFTNNPEYLEIRKYFVWACISMVPVFLVQFLNLILVYYKKSGALTTGTFIKTIILVTIMLFTIPKYGIYGAIGALIISHMVNFEIFNRIIRSIKSIGIDFTNSFLRISLFVLINILCFYFISFDNIGLFGLVQFLLIVSIIGYLDGRRMFSISKIVV